MFLTCAVLAPCGNKVRIMCFNWETVIMFSVVASSIKDVSVLRRLEFAGSFLPRGMPAYPETLAAFSVTKNESRNSLTPEQALLMVDNLKVVDKEVFKSDEELTKEIVQMKKPGSDAYLGVVLISSKDRCQSCGAKLHIRGDRGSKVTVYDDRFGTLPGTHYVKYCRKGSCSFQQHYGYFTRGNSKEVKYDEDWSSAPYFMSTRETAISMDLLHRLDTEILVGQISYKQRADIYNDVHFSHDQRLVERERLDRRRLEAAHFKYAILNVTTWYPSDLSSEVIFSPDLQPTLLEFTPLYQQAFHKKYSGHHCQSKGCGTILVLDGNQKNNRTVCAANEAGYAEYAGLPGRVKTGCMETPEQQSIFCSLHKPRQMKPTEYGGHRVIETILRKKLTRNKTLYEVLWLGMEDVAVTWEPAENVPTAVINEFEQGTVVVVQDQITKSGLGQTTHTLTVSSQGSSARSHSCSPPRTVIKESEGAFVSQPDSLVCNTEKDKEKLHHRTAGIFAGIWPCGIITLLDELFLAESKSQVYGSIHSLLQLNPAQTSELSKHSHLVSHIEMTTMLQGKTTL